MQSPLKNVNRLLIFRKYNCFYENNAKANFFKEMQGFLMSNQIVHVIRKFSLEGK
jgi:hypothetical protein